MYWNENETREKWKWNTWKMKMKHVKNNSHVSYEFIHLLLIRNNHIFCTCYGHSVFIVCDQLCLPMSCQYGVENGKIDSSFQMTSLSQSVWRDFLEFVYIIHRIIVARRNNKWGSLIKDDNFMITCADLLKCVVSPTECK